MHGNSLIIKFSTGAHTRVERAQGEEVIDHYYKNNKEKVKQADCFLSTICVMGRAAFAYFVCVRLVVPGVLES